MSGGSPGVRARSARFSGGGIVGGERRGAGAAREDRGASASRSAASLPRSKSSGGRGLKRAGALLLLALCTLAHAIDPLQFKDRAEEVRFQNLTRQLRCLVCQNQDLADSDADLAKDLRRQVFEMMRSGKSDAEIKQYLVARYNDFVLYDPPLKPGTALLWFAPGAFLLVGAAALVVVLRKRTRQSVPNAELDSGEDW